MFQPTQLPVPVFIILSFSCNNTDKQNEHTHSPGKAKDTIAVIQKQAEVKPGKTRVTEKKSVAFNYLRQCKTRAKRLKEFEILKVQNEK
ncbi:MAG: hypothetical protein ABI707_02440 [Ferruginibacter sp.]